MKSGSAESTLDDKGRISIPLAFRAQYEGKLKITWGLERCALITTHAGLENFAKNIHESQTLSNKDKAVLAYKHIGLANDVEMDKNGRIQIPPHLRKYAGLTKDCLVINSEDRLSIWDMESFFAYLNEMEPIAQEAIDKLGPINLFGAGEGR